MGYRAAGNRTGTEGLRRAMPCAGTWHAVLGMTQRIRRVSSLRGACCAFFANFKLVLTSVQLLQGNSAVRVAGWSDGARWGSGRGSCRRVVDAGHVSWSTSLL